MKFLDAEGTHFVFGLILQGSPLQTSFAFGIVDNGSIVVVAIILTGSVVSSNVSVSVDLIDFVVISAFVNFEIVLRGLIVVVVGS